MGNYEQLKQAVSDVIKTNGNQEITGAILQNTLLSIISTMGKNSTFAGIALPTTNPGTPDQNIFYIAVEPGIYSNFNGIEVKEKMCVISMLNSKWRKQEIDIYTNSIQKYFDCIGTANENIIFENGKVTLKANTNYYIFNKVGEIIRYTTTQNEEYTISNYGTLCYNINTSSLEAVNYLNLKIYHIILLFYNNLEKYKLIGGQWYNNYFQSIVKGIENNQIEVKKNIDDLYNIVGVEVQEFETSVGRISSENGNVEQRSESLYTELILDDVYEYIMFNASIYSGNYGIAFFDNDEFILGYRTTETKIEVVRIPKNCNKIKLSWNKNYVATQNIKLDKSGITYLSNAINEIDNINNEIDNINNDIDNIKSNFFTANKNLILYENLVRINEVILGSYVRANGTEGNASDWCCTNYIEVEEGQIYTAFNYKTTHVALYDSNKTIKTDVTWQSGEEIPNGVTYIRLNQQNTPTGVPITIEDVKLALVQGIESENPGYIPIFNSEEIKMPKEYVTFDDLQKFNVQPFKGKGLFCAGDSQTYYGRYFEELIRTTGMIMKGNTGELGNGGTSTQLLSFLQNMDSKGLIKWDEIDVFTVLIGGNDYGSNTNKGTFDDAAGSNTIYGGIKGVIEYVMSKKDSIIMSFFTRPERDNVENTHNKNGYWFTTKKIQGVTNVVYTGNVEPNSGCTDGGVAICGYDSEGNFLRNILEAKGSEYISENVAIPNDCKQIRICSKGSAAGVTFSFELTSDETGIPNGTILNESNIDTYREKSSYILPKGYILNNTYYNIYIWENGYCDNRSYHYAPGKNLAGNTMYDINYAILDCAKRMGIPCLDTYNMCNVVYGYNLRELMPDGTHFETELASKIGRFMGNYINTLY